MFATTLSPLGKFTVIGATDVLPLSSFVTPRVWLKRIEVTIYITKGAHSFPVAHA